MNSSIPSELLDALPADISGDAVTSAIRSAGSKGSFGGETWLLEVEGSLVVLGRGSIFDPLEALELAKEQPAVFLDREGFSAKLVICCADGERLELRPLSQELEQIEQLLERVGASPPGAVESPAAPAVAAQPDSSDPGEVELETLAAQLHQGDFAEALPLARRLAAAASDAPEQWTDLQVLLELATHAPEQAQLWGRSARSVPFELSGSWSHGLACTLEAQGEPELAWHAWDANRWDEESEQACARIEQALEQTGSELAQVGWERAQALFKGQLRVDGDDLRARRGLARALLELDQLPAAREQVGLAVAGDRSHYPTRSLEAQILRLMAIESDDGTDVRAVLIALGEDFPAHGQAYVDLADILEYDEPAEAITWLERSLDREFDEFAVYTLAQLYLGQGREPELVVLLEDALAREDPDSPHFYAEEFDELLWRGRQADPETALAMAADGSMEAAEAPQGGYLRVVGLGFVCLALYYFFFM